MGLDFFDIFLVSYKVINHLGFLLLQLFDHKVLLLLLVLDLSASYLKLVHLMKEWLELALTHFFVHLFCFLLLSCVEIVVYILLEGEFESFHGSEGHLLGWLGLFGDR